jgi:hypothetical protein
MSVFLLGTFIPSWFLGLYLIFYHHDYGIGIIMFVYGNLIFIPAIKDSILWLRNKIRHEELAKWK